jgi:serine/threonine-protein kinase
MDFGIARMEEDGEALTQLDTSGPGTPTYMAPERIDPQKFGESCPASDLYSVGIILYQLLSDGPPFRGTVSEIFNGHLHKPIDLTKLKNDISADLNHILIKALAKKPKDRFADATSFAQSLAKITKPISFSSMHSDQGEELTLSVIGLSDPQEVESTLLAPEPRNRDTQSPGTGRRRRYFFFLTVGLACCFLVVLGIYSFIKITADAPQPSETAAGTGKLENRQKTEAITSLPVSIQNNAQTPTTAMDALQESRSTTERGNQNGLTIENRIHAQQASENSEWQIIESSASRIDKK